MRTKEELQHALDRIERIIFTHNELGYDDTEAFNVARILLQELIDNYKENK